MKNKILDIIVSMAGKHNSPATRAIIIDRLHNEVFSDAPVITDITTPEETDALKMSFAVEYPAGKVCILNIDVSLSLIDFM